MWEKVGKHTESPMHEGCGGNFQGVPDREEDGIWDLVWEGMEEYKKLLLHATSLADRSNQAWDSLVNFISLFRFIQN